MMISAQLIVTVVMLQMMLSGSNNGDGSGLDIMEEIIVATVPITGAGSAFDGRMSGGEKLDMLINGKMKGMADMDGKLGMGEIDVSEYLGNVKQKITDRITSHRTFVTEKKHGLGKVLGEVIEEVARLESLVGASASASAATSTSGEEDTSSTDDTDSADSTPKPKPWTVITESGDHLKEFFEDLDFKDGETFAKTTIKLEDSKLVGLRENAHGKIDKMDKAGIDNAMKVVMAGLKGVFDNEHKFTKEKVPREVDNDKEAKKSKMVEESKIEIQRGLLASWEILQEMEEEMSQMENWLSGMEEVLGDVVGEFLGGL